MREQIKFPQYKTASGIILTGADLKHKVGYIRSCSDDESNASGKALLILTHNELIKSYQPEKTDYYKQVLIHMNSRILPGELFSSGTETEQKARISMMECELTVKICIAIMHCRSISLHASISMLQLIIHIRLLDNSINYY
jgi:hypothetical protein